MTENNLDKWINNLREEWEKHKKESGEYSNDWKAFLLWYVSEDDYIRRSIIESDLDDRKSVIEQQEWKDRQL